MYSRQMGNVLILFGIIMVMAGILVNLLPKMKIPLLPGDILIQKENFTFYFPIATSILLSLLLTAFFRIISKGKG